MIFLPQPLSGVFKIELEKVNDERGFFSRIYCQDEFRIKGLNCHWPQMNISCTKKKVASGVYIGRNHHIAMQKWCGA